MTQPAQQQDADNPADLVADGRVPERRISILKERQRDVVAAERCAEDARKLVEAVGDVAKFGLEIVTLQHRFPKLGAWERREAHPTFKQLEAFAQATL